MAAAVPGLAVDAEKLTIEDHTSAAGGEAWFIEIRNNYDSQREKLIKLSREPSRDGPDGDTVPTADVLSFRQSVSALRSALTARSGGGSPSPMGSKSPAPVRARDFEQAAASRLSTDGSAESDEDLMTSMMQQWVEVECLLRANLRTEDALVDTRTRVHDALDFDASLSAVAKECNVLKGTIFQALTAAADGSSEATAASVGVDVSGEKWGKLTRGADMLRKLIRIKVQDDNDLKAANGALASCDEFFLNLRVYSRRKNISESEIVNKDLAW